MNGIITVKKMPNFFSFLGFVWLAIYNVNDVDMKRTVWALMK